MVAYALALTIVMLLLTLGVRVSFVEERQKEAEVRRAKEVASYQANKREAQSKRDRNLRQARKSFAYAPALAAALSEIEKRPPEFLR